MDMLRLFSHQTKGQHIASHLHHLKEPFGPYLDNFNLVISCVSLGYLISDSKDSYNLPGSWILTCNEFPRILTPLKSCSSSKFFFDFLLHLHSLLFSLFMKACKQLENLNMWTQWLFFKFSIPEHIWIKPTLKCPLDIQF